MNSCHDRKLEVRHPCIPLSRLGFTLLDMQFDQRKMWPHAEAELAARRASLPCARQQVRRIRARSRTRGRKEKDVVWFASITIEGCLPLMASGPRSKAIAGTKSKPNPGPHKVYGFLRRGQCPGETHASEGDAGDLD
jgi:hypothetical protein